MRLLIIEDDTTIAETLKDLLSPQYSVDLTHNGKEGIYNAKITDYDCILLDLGLPDMTGEEICKKIRKDNISTPILILTGSDTIQDKVAALDAGADDYLTKPFHIDELSARIRAILRRSPNTMSSNLITRGDIVLDTVGRTVTRQGKSVTLRRKEFDLLEYLLRHQGMVVTRTMILDHLWDDTSNPFSNIVDVHIKYLRDRIDKPFPAPVIKTVHGLGYTIAT